MSCLARCWRNSTLRYLTPLPAGSTLAPPRTAIVRRYSQAQLLQTRNETQVNAPSPRVITRRSREGVQTLTEGDDFGSSGLSGLGSAGTSAVPQQDHALKDEAIDSINGKKSKREPDQYFAEHLNGLFDPLRFPAELAQRLLTHSSHPAAIHGHNAGFRFIGRRVIESYLLLFLNSSSALAPHHDVDSVVSRTINTYSLGEHVGSHWGLGRVLRWTPAAPAYLLTSTADREASLRSVGLYKVQGDAVSAVMGGIFYQHGGAVAHRVFHTRLLPNLLLEGTADGLPDNFHHDALSICQRMGGTEGPLTTERGAKIPSEAVAETN